MIYTWVFRVSRHDDKKVARSVFQSVRYKSSESEINMAKRSKTKMDWWHSINQVMVMFGVGLGFGIYGPSLIDLAEIYSTTPKQVAMMNSARAAGMFFGSLTGSFFYNFMNDQILTLLFLVLYGVGTVVTPVLPGIWYLHICGFLSGVSFGVAHIGAQVRLLKVWAEKSASAIQAFHSAYGVGSMVGPFLVGPFLSLRDGDHIVKESQLFIPYAAFGLLYLAMYISMIGAYLCDPKSVEKPNEENEQTDNGKISKKAEYVLMSLLFAYLTICVNTEHTYGTFISGYVIDSPHLRMAKSTAAYLAGVYWSMFTGGRLIGVIVTMFCDLQLVLSFSHGFIISASVLMIVFRSSALCAWIGSALMGLGVSSMFAASSGLVFEYIHIRHSYVGLVLTAGCLGITASAYAVPPLVEESPMFLQYWLGVGNILNTLILFAMFFAVRGRDKIIVKPIQRGSQRASISPF